MTLQMNASEAQAHRWEVKFGKEVLNLSQEQAVERANKKIESLRSFVITELPLDLRQKLRI